MLLGTINQMWFIPSSLLQKTLMPSASLSSGAGVPTLEVLKDRFICPMVPAVLGLVERNGINIDINKYGKLWKVS